MLNQPLLDRLRELRLPGFRTALEEQIADPRYASLSFEERLGLLVDRECLRRESNRLERALAAGRFPDPNAHVENMDLEPERGLKRPIMLELAQAHWVGRALNVVVLGPTGAGKSFVACALGRAACRHGYSVRYLRLPRLLHDLKLAAADGSYLRALATLSRIDLIVVDDFLRDPLTAPQSRDIVELLEDRYGRKSTLVATQVPIAEWHARLPDPTLADAVLDRLVHNAHRLELTGESQRKRRSPLVTNDDN
jgi:DNA replication protein DnaC